MAGFIFSPDTPTGSQHFACLSLLTSDIFVISLLSGSGSPFPFCSLVFKCIIEFAILLNWANSSSSIRSVNGRAVLFNSWKAQLDTITTSNGYKCKRHYTSIKNKENTRHKPSTGTPRNQEQLLTRFFSWLGNTGGKTQETRFKSHLPPFLPQFFFKGTAFFIFLLKQTEISLGKDVLIQSMVFSLTSLVVIFAAVVTTWNKQK